MLFSEENIIVSEIQRKIDQAKTQNISVGNVSDGYHTFNELYHHRALLFASLLMTTFKDKAWKSKKHDDNTMYDGMFIVGVETPYGQATYHYDIDPYWDLFKGVKEIPYAPKFDGHSPEDALNRIYEFALERSNQ